MLVFNILIFLIGLIFLYIGAELLISGSSCLARLAHIRPLIIGVTVIAFGTSSPEILVSFVAAWSDKMDVALGNIIGSNISNIGLILGLSCLFRPLHLSGNTGKKEVFIMLIATIIFWFFSTDGRLSHLEGLILLSGIILFILYLTRTVIKDRNINIKNEDIPREAKWIQKHSRVFRLSFYSAQIISGMVILITGSKLTINSAIYIAGRIGVSEAVIGLSLVAFGTSLPELATTIIAIIKKEQEILIGNIIGSNLFNLLFVAGSISTFFQVGVNERMCRFDILVMFVLSAILVILVLMVKKISRFMGMILMIYYLGYIFYIYSWK